MVLTRLQRRFTTWLAALSLVLGALAPTLSQAMVVGADRSDWLEICSVSGMVWIKADTGEVSRQSPDGEAPASDVGNPCPWCTLHGGGAGVPVEADATRLPARLTDLPPAFYRAPSGATVWAPAQSRAPPAAA